jgi:hypothetical protein
MPQALLFGNERTCKAKLGFVNLWRLASGKDG